MDTVPGAPVCGRLAVVLNDDFPPLLSMPMEQFREEENTSR